MENLTLGDYIVLAGLAMFINPIICQLGCTLFFCGLCMCSVEHHWPLLEKIIVFASTIYYMLPPTPKLLAFIRGKKED